MRAIIRSVVSSIVAAVSQPPGRRPLSIIMQYGPVTRGQSYTSAAPKVTGGVGALTFSTESNLYGLALNSSTGVISGTPNDGSSATIDYDLAVTVTDSRGRSASSFQLWRWSGGAPA